MKPKPTKPRFGLSANTWILMVIIILFLIAVWVLVPGSTRFGREGMRLGLDLKGGTHLVYEADFAQNATDAEKSFALDRAISTIKRRIDRYGVTEPIVQKQGNDRILVQLPGVSNLTEAKKLIEETAFLDFREVELNGETPVYLSDYLALNASSLEFFDTSVEEDRRFADARYIDAKDNPITLPVSLTKNETGNLTYVDDQGIPVDDMEAYLAGKGLDSTRLLSWMPAMGKIDGEQKQLTGAYLTKARPVDVGQIAPELVVAIEWNSDGTKIFNQIAARLWPRPDNSIQRSLGIFLDNEIISQPEIVEEEYGSEATITGDFSWDEVRLLAMQLESGALPMPLKQPPLFEENVSATLGAKFIDYSLLAGLIGLGLVMMFMILYYRLPGGLASLALLIYGALVLAIFKLIPITLTLAGIAGFVLSIGMAVDANILIFERLKEELRGGRTLGTAIETGFNRAWVAIRDSNISTFIICGILYWFGSSIVESAPVKGFAITLFIGVAVSMFSAIIITRTFLRFFKGAWATRHPSLFGVEPRKPTGPLR